MNHDGVSKIVTVGLALLLAIVGCADIWLSLRWSPEVSVSATIWRLSRDYPALPFAAGMLAGHLFWR